jgi:DtxR family Mn-dependent transcriptional regulator
MREQLTHAIEDYLKAIYKLSTRHGRATTNLLAERLDVTPASVSGMIKKLSNTDPPLVDYQKHRGVVLTETGEKIALEILRHHRLLELYLHQMLGYPWELVHEEADRLEHVISEEFEERIAEALGHPLHDPHGDPIPTADLQLPPTSTHALYELREGERAVIQRVRDSDPELLAHLSELGLIPQVELVVQGYSEFDHNLTVQIVDGAQTLVLGPRITQQIFVDVIAEII